MNHLNNLKNLINNIVFHLLFGGVFISPLTLFGQDHSSILNDMLNGKPVEIVNQSGLNTPHLEFSPVLYNNRLVYIGNGRTKDRRSNSEDYFNIYSAEIGLDGTIDKEIPFSEILNSFYHEGPLSFNASFDEIFFTRNHQKEGEKKVAHPQLSIYHAVYGEEDWQNPTEFLAGTAAYSFCHPALSPDGQRLYFSSNIPGGFGNYDLYYIERTASGWSNAFNLGPMVNSGDNELFPTITSEGFLFFSSGRAGGLGGLDIYMADAVGNFAQKAILLPPPVNSASDDLGMIYDEERNKMWFSSSRPGGVGQDDIYTLVPGQKTGTDIIEQRLIVVDDASNQRLQHIDIVLKSETFSEDLVLQTNRNGVALIDLAENQSFAINITASGYTEFNDSYEAGNPVTVRLKPKPCINLTGYAMDNENKMTLHNVTIGIVTICDGDTIHTMTNEDGKMQVCIPANCPAQIIASHKDYYTIKMPLDPLQADLVVNLNFEKQKVSIINEPLEIGGVITLENIYYDFNKSSIRPGAERELNELVIVMNQYPDMQIELVAHTDTRGDPDFNLQLSKERALSAKRFLIAQGILESRILTSGKGETEPRNRCKKGVNCTEEEHQFNRRTEVHILKK